MRKSILYVLLAALLLTSITPAFAAEATDIQGYNKKTKYQYVTFGTFPVEADGTEGPLLWRVLEVKNNEAYLLTEYIVDVHYVHLDTVAYYDTKWEDSDLFAYLQNDFMNRAFSAGEQAVILQRTEDGGLVTLPHIDDMRNAKFGFDSNNSRLCTGTEYAKEIGLYIYTKKHSPWISRNKSESRPQQQRRVMSEGKLGTVPCGNVDLGIRPCVYVDLTKLTISGGSGTKDNPWVLTAEDIAPVEVPVVTEAPVAQKPVEVPAEKEEIKPVATEMPKPVETVQPIATEKPAAVEKPVVSKAFTAAANPESIHEKFPALADNGFLPDGEEEFVYADDKDGLWLYASQTLRIEINRRTGTNSKKQPLRWYEAEIYTKDTDELFKLYPHDEAKYTNRYALEEVNKIAAKNHLVFAINSDYFIYRVSRDAEVSYNYPIGVIIRNGKVFYDQPRKASSAVYPPLDTMALYPDGTVSLHKTEEITANELIAAGAVNTLSFGPILVENGEVSPRSKEFGNTPNPRTAFGVVEPGYYIAVMVESRVTESKGESCVWLGELMAQLGCESAINLDGGATSTMLFMGKQINKTGNYGDITNRKQNELFGIGYSEAVK